MLCRFRSTFDDQTCIVGSHLSITPVKYLVDTWTEIKRGRDLQRKTLAEELAQLEAVMQVCTDCRPTE
jgi:hypothetical protein